MDNYNQIKVTASLADSETAIAVMTAMDFFGGLMIEDFSDIENAKGDYIDEELLSKDRNIVCVSGFVAQSENIISIMDRLKILLPKDCKVEVIGVAEKDWANNWKKYYKPIRVGKNIVIKPSWEEYIKKESDVVVELDPGMAFGTGTHETTRMCMAHLEKYITKEKSVLDVGCGSGILSITSILLGAKNVVGVDIDPVATKVAVQNGEMNGFYPPQYIIKRGNLVDEISGTFDIVVANIVADVIISLCPDVKQFLKEDGIFISSGIILDREDDVKNALNENEYNIIDCVTEGEWVSLVCKRRH